MMKIAMAIALGLFATWAILAGSVRADLPTPTATVVVRPAPPEFPEEGFPPAPTLSAPVFPEEGMPVVAPTSTPSSTIILPSTGDGGE